MGAFVLSGGGNRGALQAGAADVLITAGVTPDLLVGTSVGAVNAAFLAAGPTPARSAGLVDLWRGMSGREVFPGSRLERLVHLVLGHDHLYSSDGLRRLLREHLPYERIEQAAIPLVLVATDLVSGTERRLTHGSVVDAVAASAAIPGIFPPVEIEGELLCDGAVAANLPIAAAAAAGASEAWVFDTVEPCSSPRHAHGAVDIALQALAHLGHARAQAELLCPPGNIVLHHLALICASDRRFSDFSATSILIDEGAAIARAYLLEHRSAPGVTESR